MRLRVEETYAGELQDRLSEAIKALRALVKSEPPERKARWEYAVLQEATRRSKRQADRLRVILEKKLAAVLED